MKVLIVGSGGREHALAWKAIHSKSVTEVYVAPGNGGTSNEEGVTNVDIAAEDINRLAIFATEHRIDLTIVGPEVPLVRGITDKFESLNLNCFGPSREAAQLEGSKEFMKDFLCRHEIPTAVYQSFSDLESAMKYLEGSTVPIVIKADGLAAGKGLLLHKVIRRLKRQYESVWKKNLLEKLEIKLLLKNFLKEKKRAL
mgnify:CR=1 FL=1